MTHADDLSGIPLAADRARRRSHLWGLPIAALPIDRAAASMAALTAALEAAEARAEGAEAEAWAEHQRAERFKAHILSKPQNLHDLNCIYWFTDGDDACDCDNRALRALLQEPPPC